MLALFRVERALNFTIAYQISKSVPCFQKCYSCGGMSNNYKMIGGNSHKTSAERKKHKSIASVWRPVSIQSCSADDGHGEAEVGIELAEPHNDPTILSNKEENNASGGSVSPTNNHSISMEGLPCFDSSNEKGTFGTSTHYILDFIPSIHIERLIHTYISTKYDAFFIILHRGSVQSKIEEEMGIKIIFPLSRMEESIIIEGNSLDSITRASERIQLIIDEAVNSPALDYSHFISLPLAIHPQLVDKLVNFQNSILGLHDTGLDSSSNKDSTDEENGDQKLNKATQVAATLKAQEDTGNAKVDVTNIPLVSYPPKSSAASASKAKSSTLLDLGIDRSIFIKPKTFHLTVLMLKLWNKERVDAALKIFEGIEDEIMDALEGRPVSIKLKGLDCMRGSLAKARVLYAPVEVIGGEDGLLQACKVISEAFTKGGLVLEKDAKQALKLHATVMNARHRKRTKTTKRYDSFDARGVMEKYGSEEWGEYLIREVHLSQRFVFDEDGYYHRCASISLPQNVQVD